MGKRRHEFERTRRGIWEGLKRPGQGKWRHYIIISDIKGIIKTFQACMWLCMLHAYECVGTHTWACSCRGQSRKSDVFLYHFSQRLSQTRKSSLSWAALPGSYWNSSVSSPQGWGLGSCMSGLFTWRLDLNLDPHAAEQALLTHGAISPVPGFSCSDQNLLMTFYP